ncbi:MAG: threonine/serine exporter family protein, partial [Aeromicrobium sp.]|uniref:threonine/serine exporter family protein n=1 Tax=Aeromicrobium sp. TaxID=1871063 RepID=UPI003C56011E
MPDVHVSRTLDLALRVGEMLLSNGAGAADVTATMGSITHHLGVRQAQVDLTFTTLTMSHQQRPDAPASTATRHVTHRETDFDDLTSVDLLVADLLDDAIDLDEARSRLAQIASTGHRAPRWA